MRDDSEEDELVLLGDGVGEGEGEGGGVVTSDNISVCIVPKRDCCAGVR